MLIAKIAVTGVRATSTKLGTLTSGMVGAKVQFTFDSSWEGLNKTAVFRCMDITKDVLNIDSEVTIPHEALVRSGSPLYAGVYGTNAAGDLVIPTRWATVGIVYSGADPSGDPSTERSPDVWEQLQNQINALKNQGADADAIKQAVDAYMAANPQTESDPTVPNWAKQPNPPAVQFPTTLPNPHKLTFTGAVQAEYDGSEAVSVEIPEGGSGGGNFELIDTFDIVTDMPNQGDSKTYTLDGVSEILLVWTDMMNGTSTESSLLVQFHDGKAFNSMTVRTGKNGTAISGFTLYRRLPGVGILPYQSKGAVSSSNYMQDLSGARPYNIWPVSGGSITKFMIYQPVTQYYATSGQIKVYVS